MTTIEKSIEVEVPVRRRVQPVDAVRGVPEVHGGRAEVRQMDDKSLHWSAEIGGKEEQWIAEITEQVPDERIAWRSAGRRSAMAAW